MEEQGSVQEQNSFDWLPKDGEGGHSGEEEEDGWGSEFDFDDDDQVPALRGGSFIFFQNPEWKAFSKNPS